MTTATHSFQTATQIELPPQHIITPPANVVDFRSAFRDPTATLMDFKLDDLALFKRARRFNPRDSHDFRVFYVGRDNVHGALKYLLARTSVSIKLNMFGYDDEELDALIHAQLTNSHVYVQGTLDKSQAGGVHEKAILKEWDDSMRNSFAIGTSATHQITHTKGGVLDGLVAFEGSTNWSASGEGILEEDLPSGTKFKAQNNTLVVFTNPVEVHDFSVELDEEHTTALQQQLKSEQTKARPSERTKR